MDVGDCQPDFCLDIYESNNKRNFCTICHAPHHLVSCELSFLLSLPLLPTIGHGRKRRAIEHDDKNMTEYTKFKENLQYTVLMPGESSSAIDLRDGSETCKNFVVITGLLAGLLALSTVIVSLERVNFNFIFEIYSFISTVYLHRPVDSHQSSKAAERT